MMIQMMMQAAQRGMSPTQFFQQYGNDPNIAPFAKIVQKLRYKLELKLVFLLRFYG